MKPSRSTAWALPPWRAGISSRRSAPFARRGVSMRGSASFTAISPGALRALNRTAEARAVLHVSTDRAINPVDERPTVVLARFSRRRRSHHGGVGETSGRFRETPTWRSGGRRRVLAYRGRVSAAHEQFGRGIRSAERSGVPQLAAELTLEDAEIHAIAGQCRRSAHRSRCRAGAEPRLLRVGSRQPRSGAMRRRLGRQRSAEGTVRTVSPGDPLEARASACRRGAESRFAAASRRGRSSNSTQSGRMTTCRRGSCGRRTCAAGPILQLKDWTAAANEFRLVLDHRGVRACVAALIRSPISASRAPTRRQEASARHARRTKHCLASGRTPTRPCPCSKRRVPSTGACRRLSSKCPSPLEPW